MHFWRSATGVIALVLWFYAIGNLPLGHRDDAELHVVGVDGAVPVGGAVWLGASRVDSRLVGGGAGRLRRRRAGAAARRSQTEQALARPDRACSRACSRRSPTCRSPRSAAPASPTCRVVFYFSIGGSALGAVLATCQHRLARPHRAAARCCCSRSACSPPWRRLMMTRGLPHRPHAHQCQPAVPGHRVLVRLRRAAVRRRGDGWWRCAGMLLIVGAGLAATLLRSRSPRVADTADTHPPKHEIRPMPARTADRRRRAARAAATRRAAVAARLRLRPRRPGAGERAYARGPPAGRALRRTSTATCAAPKTGRNGRHPLPDARRLRRDRWRAAASRPATPVVALRRPGRRRTRRALWWMLRWLGHADVAVLDGGIGRVAARPAARSTDAAARSRDRARPIPLGRRSMPTRRRRRSCCAAARPRAGRRRARGRALSRRGRAARPGRRPHPGRAQPLPQGQPRRRRPLQARRRAARRVRGAARRAPPARVVHQCGSGVTACHNLLAMEHAGLAGSALYPGSWSEWSRRPGAAGGARARLRYAALPTKRRAD